MLLLCGGHAAKNKKSEPFSFEKRFGSSLSGASSDTELFETIVVQFIFETIGWQFACITSRWAAVLKKQLPSIPIISVHGLRHTHASVLLFAGVSIASVVALTLFTLQKKRGSVQSKTLLVFFRGGYLISYATLKA